MSDRIKSNDVIDDELFIKVSQNAEAFMKNLTIVEAGLKAILVEAKNVMATTVFGSSADIEKYAEAVLKVAKAQEVLAKAEVIREKAQTDSIKRTKEEIKVSQEREKLAQQELKTKTAVNKETERAEKAKLKEAKSQSALTSEYKQAVAELKRLDDRMLDNSVAGREMSKTGRLVAESQKELRDKILGAELAIGRSTRLVGDYGSRWNGLGNSLNQITREMPAFANSVQTGFMAISNNLPIFFDEIKKTQAQIKLLRAEGQQIPGLFSQLTGAIFSWGTALSVGVTLLTLYGKELVEFISTLGDADEGFKLSYEAQSKYYVKLRELIEKQTDSQLKLNVAQGKMTQEAADEFKLNYDKKQAIIKLKSDYQKELLDIQDVYNKSISYINQNTGGSDAQRENNLKAQLNYQRAYKESTDRFNALLKATETATANEIATIKENERTKAEKDAEKDAEKADRLNKKRLEDLKDFRDAEQRYDDEKKARAKAIIDEYNAKADVIESDGTVWYDKENGITVEDHNIQVQMQEDFQKKKAADAEKAAEEKKKKRAQEAREEFDTAVAFIDQLNRIKSDKLDRQLSDDISMRQRNIIQQQQLAAQGLDNTLAIERAALAKDELARQQQARKRERDAKTLAFIKLIAAYADKGDDQAVTKAFLQMAIATAITGSFAEGVEGLEGPGTETSDSILARLSKGESVATARATRENPGMVTAMNKGKIDEYFEKEYLPKYITSQDVGSFGENMINSLMLQQITALNKRIESFEKIVKERPVHQTDLTPLGDIVDTRIANGMKRVTTKKSNSPLNWI